MNPDSQARRESARQTDGKFGPQEHAEATGGTDALTGTSDRSSRIDGRNRQVLALTNDDYSALNALLYELDERPEILRALNTEFSVGLGANHIESLTTLWRSIHSTEGN